MVRSLASLRSTWRPLAVLTSAALAVTLTATVSATTAVPFVGHARDTYGIGAAPSGIVRFDGLGAGTYGWTITGEAEVGECAEFSFEATATLAAGTIDWVETDLFCPASASSTSRGIGAPYFMSGTFTITGGTAAFAGASGGGTTSGGSAGNAIQTRYDGTVWLP